MPRNPDWTPQEKIHLTRLYPRLGPARTHEWFKKHGYNRSEDAIRKNAGKTGLKVGVPRGYMSVGEATELYSGASNVQGTREMLIRRAKEDGVLFESLPSKQGYVYCSVPEEWAWRELDEYATRIESETKGWWTVKELAFYLNAPVYKLHNALMGKWPASLRVKLDQVEKVRGVRRKWLFNPESVMEVFHEQRQAA